MLKYIIEIILVTIIIFFIWNIMKRLFLSSFYKNFPNPENKNMRSAEPQKKIKENLKWDAETVEYEEIKENQESKK